ncbi:uncharacterized protein LOC109594922 isoform X2 [Aethina tumida]|nr:uncharacterized protein LOC109594922 isoform X2 [Aethina tumida]
MIQRKKRNSTDPSNLPRGLPRAAVQFAATGDTNRIRKPKQTLISKVKIRICCEVCSNPLSPNIIRKIKRSLRNKCTNRSNLLSHKTNADLSNISRRIENNLATLELTEKFKQAMNIGSDEEKLELQTNQDVPVPNTVTQE